MRQHGHAIARQMQICFDGVCTGGHGTVERGHGVLGEKGLVTPVPDVLGQLGPFPSSGDRRIIGAGGVYYYMRLRVSANNRDPGPVIRG
jgi:hypothetical protein